MRVNLRVPHPLAPGIPRAVSVSFTAHVLLLLSIWLVPSLVPRPSYRPLSFDDAIMANIVDAGPDLAGAPPLQPAAAAAPSAPEPPPQAAEIPPPPPPEKPKPRPEPRKKDPPPEPKPKKVRPSKTEPRPEDRPPSPGETGEGSAGGGESGSPPSAAAAPGGAPAGGAGDGVGLSFGGTPFGYGYYQAQLMNKLRASWQRPVPPPGADGVLSVRVRFRIARGGAVSQVEIEMPSPYPLLDDSALRAVYRAAPFPPLPPTFTKDVLDAAVTFTLEPTTL